MKIIAKRKMPEKLQKNYAHTDGWPTAAVRQYIKKVAVECGVDKHNFDSVNHVYTHADIHLLYPAKDAYIWHCVKESCYRNKLQDTLCIRVTKIGKTIIIAEHPYGTCKRINRFSR